MMAAQNEPARQLPAARVSEFTLVVNMNALVGHLWWSGSEQTDWDGTGFRYEEPYGWEIVSVGFDTAFDPVKVTIRFRKAPPQ